MLDSLILFQLFGQRRVDDLASAQNMDMVCIFRCKPQVLFNQENGDAALLQSPNDLSDGLDKNW